MLRKRVQQNTQRKNSGSHLNTQRTKNSPSLSSRDTQAGFQLPHKFLLKSEQQSIKNSGDQEQDANTAGLLKKIKHTWLQKRIRHKLRAIVPPAKILGQFEEEWEAGPQDEQFGDQVDQQKQSEYLFQRFSGIYAIIELMGCIIHMIYIWFVSVQLIIEDSDEYVFYIASCAWITLYSLYILLHLNTENTHMSSLIRTRTGILKKYFMNEAGVDCVSIICAVVCRFLQQSLLKNLVLILQLATLLQKIKIRYKNVEDCFENIIGQGLFKLISSFVLLIFFAHGCALTLYVSSFVNPDNNWLDKISFEERNWFCDYVYSLYWAVTIIVTVGFGDIGPKNKYEIGIVLLIEILGTSFFGYMINVIGMTLTDLQKEREAFESTLKNADKLCQCFGLDSSLSYRLRTFLKDNQRVDSMFSLADEKKIMEKLSPSLKMQVLRETNYQIIEKCIFFLTYFNLTFLGELSLKLSKRIYQPGEELAINPSNPKMYIIDTGSIDIEVMRNHRSKVITKKGRTITRQSNKEVGNNLYGYVVCLTSHNSKINAVSTSFTFVYELTKKDFFDCMQPGSTNYQISCELKHRYMERKLIDEIEVPELTNPALHYTPNTLLIVSHLNRNLKYRPRNLFLIRRRRTQSSRLFFTKGIMIEEFIDRSSSRISESLKLAQSHGKFLRSIIRGDQSAGRRSSTPQITETCFDDIDDWSLLEFESIKEYNNYMVTNNVSNVLQKYRAIMSNSRKNLIEPQKNNKLAKTVYFQQ